MSKKGDHDPFQQSNKVMRTPSAAGKEDICNICNTRDGPGNSSVVDWIDCDECKLWIHPVCANVDKSIESWICDACKTKTVSRSEKRRSKTGSVRSSVRQLQIELQLHQMEEEMEMKRKQLAMEMEAEKKAQQEEEVARKLEEAARKLAREREKEIRDKMREAELELHRKKIELIRESFDEHNNDDRTSVSTSSQILSIRKWLSNTKPNEVKVNTLGDGFLSSQMLTLENIKRHQSAIQLKNRLEVDTRPNAAGTDSGSPFQPCVPNKTTPKDEPGQHLPPKGSTSNDTIFVDDPVITNKHLMSRRSLQTDLPKFGGSPEEWPPFINEFEATTKTCGFSNIENLSRLRKCLTDKARRAVEDMLISPENVPEIIETLRDYFGQPKMIIMSLVRKVRQHPSIKINEYDLLIEFSFAVRNLYARIKSSGLTSHLSDPCLIDDLVQKLDSITKIKWLEYKAQYKEDTLPLFSEWITQYARNFIGEESAQSSSVSKKISQPESKRKGVVNTHSEPAPTNKTSNDASSSRSKPTNGSASSNKCAACMGQCKTLLDCKKFLSCDLNEKYEIAKKAKVCRRCLVDGHWYMRCKKVCGKNGCTFRHHSLLHDDQLAARKRSAPEVESQVEPPTTNTGQINIHCQKKSFLYQVVPVIIHNGGKIVSTYAFLDSGSSLTLVEEKLADEIGLGGNPVPLSLSWSDNSQRHEEESRQVSFEISGTWETSRKYTITNASTVKKLVLPKQTVSRDDLEMEYAYLRGVPLASFQNATPRILIGIDNGHLLSSLKSIEGKPGQLFAAKTRLGWTVFGTIPTKTDDQLTLLTHHDQLDPDQILHQLVEEYFAFELAGLKSNKAVLSADEVKANELLESTTTRIGQRFETGLLWKYNKIDLPNSLPTAQRRFDQLEKKMSNDPELADKLRTLMKEYVKKQYARKLSSEEMQKEHPKTWYLPIFLVLNKNKPGKLRLVWDAASAVNGVSLNSMLLSGPDQLTSLISVLYQFRQRKFAINADISEMFHQIRIKADDQHAQRFLWRDDQHSNVDVYLLEVMTFGSTCSPSSAQFIKNKNAQEFATQFPRAAKSIIENHYVDDLLDSVNTEEEAIQLAQEVKFVHSQAGFHIRNWRSNSPTVVKVLGESELTQTKNLNFDQEETTEKVLGMWWCVNTDTFQYKITHNEANTDILSGGRIPTKRELLKIVMSVYDPLGLLSHFLVLAKIILQDVWRSQLGWDEQMNDDQNKKWSLWVSLLPQIEDIRIPRWYLREICFDDASTQLHLFADAGQEAYAAVGFFRVEIEGKVEVALVGAKSRVAPLKQLSIPRLELEAAVLASRLSKDILDRHTIHVSKIFMWSDSRTVLCWIRSDHRKYRQFVAHRVSEILDHTHISNWRWVPTKYNVADDATKWPNNPKFDSTDRWFVGPEFLYHPESLWPEDLSLKMTTSEEIKPHNQHLSSVDNSPLNAIDALRFSRWHKWYGLWPT